MLEPFLGAGRRSNAPDGARLLHTRNKLRANQRQVAITINISNNYEEWRDIRLLASGNWRPLIMLKDEAVHSS
jgi:hypothetical protein